MDLSIIVTASYSPSHPEIKYIEEVIESLELLTIKTTEKIDVFLGHDAINPISQIGQDKYKDYSKKYCEYFENLDKYINNYNNTNIKFNLILIKHNEWGHLSGNIRKLIPLIKTNLLLVLQQDLPFCEKININSIIQDMIDNPKLKHIQFNRTKNIPIHWYKDKHNFFNNHNVVTKDNTYVSTLAWADQNHMTTLNYYKEIVLKECYDGIFMEAILHKNNNNPSTHPKYGTYLFGKYNDGPYIIHSARKNAIFWESKYKT